MPKKLKLPGVMAVERIDPDRIEVLGGKPWDLPTYIKSLVSLIVSAKKD